MLSFKFSAKEQHYEPLVWLHLVIVSIDDLHFGDSHYKIVFCVIETESSFIGKFTE